MGKRQIKRNNRSLCKLVFAVSMVSFLFTGWGLLSLVMAKVPDKPALASDMQKREVSQATLAELLSKPFIYQRSNRSNPFTPFMKKTTTSATPAGGNDIPEERLTGMQLFEPGQLRLVSIVFANSRTFAMVQDSLGQGYIIRKGTKIGRRGVVAEILHNIVVINQWSLTFSGQKRYTNIEMILRKEGE